MTRIHVALLFAVLAVGLWIAFVANRTELDGVGTDFCSEKQLLGYTPNAEETKAHRTFNVPAISYPAGTRLNFERGWGLTLTIRVDKSGRVVCYDHNDGWFGRLPLNRQRGEMLEGLRKWTYRPFTANGQVVPAIVSEEVREQELPQEHKRLPDAPLTAVSITLERTACFGTCPAYAVTVDGSGTATYRGDRFVDVRGTHSFHVEPVVIARLVESLRSKDIWSLRTKYEAPITDNPTYRLTIAIGSERRTIEDYAGAMVGMPAVISQFEDEVDSAAQSEKWINLSTQAVEHLKSEQFDFHSPDGAAMLARAIANERTHDDQAILTLMRLDTPLTASTTESRELYDAPNEPIIESALHNRRAVLIDELISRGMLQTDGKLDQKKIDAAFRAAIAGGRLDLVQKIWSVSGSAPHPSLVFPSTSERDSSTSKAAPVTLLLSHSPYDHDASWEGFAVAKWLIARGCDMKATAADGTTLLHIAAHAGDAALVRYLLEAGFDPSTPGRFGLPALGGAYRQDVAMLLLRAGTNMAKLNDDGQSFRRFAVENHWEQVVGWLDAHDH